MAYKKYNKISSSEGKSVEDRALEQFSEIMIDKINDLDKSNWEKPWFVPGAVFPKNLEGREYNGYNSVMLLFLQEKYGWKTGRFATFKHFRSLNFRLDANGQYQQLKDKDGNDLPWVSVKGGELSTSVFLNIKYAEEKETRKRIEYRDYMKLSDEEREKYDLRSVYKEFRVYNIDQTNLKETRPEMYQKFLDEYKVEVSENKDMAAQPVLDTMFDKGLWVCPIRQEIGPDAYYRPSTDEIVLPSKDLFFKGEAFYGTALHEMAHSTGASNRLNRSKGNIFGSPEYAKEELIAELSSALLCSKMGFSKSVSEEIRDNSANYLKSWLGALSDDTKYIKSVLLDVQRASTFIGNRYDEIEERLTRDGEKADFSDIIEEDRLGREKLLKPEESEVAASAVPQQSVSDNKSPSVSNPAPVDSVTVKDLYPFIDSLTVSLKMSEVDLLASVASDLLTGEHLIRPRSEEQKALHNEVETALQAVVKRQELAPRQAALLSAMSESFFGSIDDMAEQLSIDKVNLLHSIRGAGNGNIRSVQGLEDYSELSILESVRHDIEERLEDVEDVELKGMAIHGSRKRGDAREDSDLDVVVEYSGDMSEDGLFNIINEDPIEVGGIRVDVNPIKAGKSGTLEEYMERSRRYDAEKTAHALGEAKAGNRDYMQEFLGSMTGMQAGKAEANLTKRVNFDLPDGSRRIMTNSEFVLFALDKGLPLHAELEKSSVKDEKRLAINRAFSSGNYHVIERNLGSMFKATPEMKRLEEVMRKGWSPTNREEWHDAQKAAIASIIEANTPTRTVYMVKYDDRSYLPVSKTMYDFGQYVLRERELEKSREGTVDRPSTVSPLVQQYLDIKARHPQSVLLLHIGDGYETYQEDARLVSSTLGLPLQSSALHKGPDGKPAVFVSFPERDIHDYLSSLVGKPHQYSVAILEDMNEKALKDRPSITDDRSEGLDRDRPQEQAEEQRRGGGMRR